MRFVLVALLLVVVTGCSTRYRKANNLAKEGKFIEAAELFEQLAHENPNDKELPKLVERARWRAIEDTLGRARQLRLTEDPVGSQQYFAKGLELRRRWNVRLNGALEQTVEDEREDATRRLRGAVLPHAQRGEALTAEDIVNRHAFLLQHDELSALRTELTEATYSSGAATCQRLTPTASRAKPYWTSLVAQYCKHFQASPPVEVPLPDTFAIVQPHVAVNGLSEGTQGDLALALEAEVRRGPWYSEQGPLQASLTTQGEAAVRQRQEPVRLTAEWYEEVPYVEYVKKTLKESVPVEECQSYDEKTASGEVVQRVRTVTREKTSKKEVVVPETRIRHVPRSFDYQAHRVQRTASFTAKTELIVGGQLASSAGHQASEEEHGYLHDVTFRPGKVKPSRPQFKPIERWFGGNTQQLAHLFGASMREGWRIRFCSQGEYEPEQAARCLRAGELIPDHALRALEPSLGRDSAHVVKLMGPGAPKRR